MAKTFEETINRLQNEVAIIKAENRVLKSERNCGEDD